MSCENTENTFIEILLEDGSIFKGLIEDFDEACQLNDSCIIDEGFDTNSLNKTSLNLFDLRNPDIRLFNSMDDEIIKISGSRILYFKYQPSKEFDDVYQEDRNKVIAKQAVAVHGHYDPKAIEENLSKFGMTLESEQVFTFNKSYITRRLGRVPIAGDIIKPVFQPIRFKIYEVQEDGFESYGIYHLVCSAKILRDSDEVQESFLPSQSDPIGNKDHE